MAGRDTPADCPPGNLAKSADILSSSVILCRLPLLYTRDDIQRNGAHEPTLSARRPRHRQRRRRPVPGPQPACPPARGRAEQGRPGRRLDLLGAGRRGRGTRRRRRHRIARAGHPDRRRRPVPRGRGALHRRTQPRGDPVADRPGRALHPRRGTPRGRPRLRLPPDPRGRPQPPAHHPCRRRHRHGDLQYPAGPGAAMPEHRAARAARGGRPDHRAQARRQGPALPRRLRAEPHHRRGRHLLRALRGPGHRWRRQGLPVHQQSGRHLRRRHRHGLARRLPGRQPGVQPVPPDLPVPPAGEEFPDHRSAARRRRPAQTAQRRTLHGALRPARRAGPGGARTSPPRPPH